MDNSNTLLLLAVGLAILLTTGLLRFWSRLNWVDTQMPPVKLLGVPSPLLTWIKYKRKPIFKPDWDQLKAEGLLVLELSLIIGWAIWFGRRYLNFDADMWPVGGEFIMDIQNHYLWRLFGKCGACVFWNGFTNGGAPAFVDLHSSWLHPIVILATLIWGEINGAKVTLIASFIMAGMAQWYLAKVLHLGTIPRVWSAFIAVAGGHLAGRMENGGAPLIISMAACSLVIPFVVDLVWNKHRQAAIGLGITLGLAFLAGQGYIQIGLLFCLIPTLILLPDKKQEKGMSISRYILWAGIMAVLLSAILWVPFLHFLPNWEKYTDASLAGSMPLAYGPLTLVMDDPRLLNPDIFHGGVYMFTNFIGWIPVIFALIPFLIKSQNIRRLQVFFILAILLSYMMSAALPFKLLIKLWPQSMASIRYPAVIAGLAVPFVLGLAAWGLDTVIKLNWPVLFFGQRRISNVKTFFEFNTSWLLCIPLIWSIRSAEKFSTRWIYLRDSVPNERNILKNFETQNTEWVQPPWGEFEWFAHTRELDLKMAYMFRPWIWKGRQIPSAYIEGTHGDIDPATAGLIKSIDNVNIILHPENEYASVETSTGHIPCKAQAQGGNIDVVCQTEVDGELVVQENSWSGWHASLDGNSVNLISENWLRVKAPAGYHRYTFRYRPWDVPLGIALSLLGIALSIFLWFRWSEANCEVFVSNTEFADLLINQQYSDLASKIRRNRTQWHKKKFKKMIV
jgi:hypothetical protein